MENDQFSKRDQLEMWLRLYEGAGSELRSVDGDLNSTQSSFLAIAAMCLPVITKVVTEAISPGISVLSTAWCAIASCQVAFFVIFFALMQVRLRNILVAYLRYYADKINRLYIELTCDSSGVPMRQGSVHLFYLSDTKSWLASYVFASAPLFVLFICSIWFVFDARSQIGELWVFVALELAACLYYAFCWSRTTAARRYEDLRREAGKAPGTTSSKEDSDSKSA